MDQTQKILTYLRSIEKDEQFIADPIHHLESEVMVLNEKEDKELLKTINEVLKKTKTQELQLKRKVNFESDLDAQKQSREIKRKKI